MAPLRFGLVGTGYWALHAHGTALVASPHAALQGVWGRDQSKASDLAKRLGAKSYDDLDDLLRNVDAVSIALPPDVQAEVAVRAARAGCHLLLEKPLALGREAAEAVVSAVDEAGVAAIVFFTNRFRPEAERWSELACAAGPWHSAHLVHYANIYQPGSPYAASPWRRESGALWDIGPHGLSALLPIMGPVTSVVARSGPLGSDTVHLVFTHGQQALGPRDDRAPSPDQAPSADDQAGASTTGAAGPLGATAPAGPPGSGPVGPWAASTVSLSLTMPPAASTSQLVLYGEHGARSRPESHFEPAEALENAVAELAEMARTGQRRHRCDARFGLEVVRALSAAEEALRLPGAQPF